MRVLQVGKFFPPVVGGIESATWELAEGLSRAGIANAVLCASTDRHTRREDRPAGYRVTRAASFGQVLSTSVAPAMAGLLREAAAECDLIHLHMPDPMAALALWWVRPGVPLVLHWHSDVIRQRLSRRLYAPLEHWLMDRADAIIATSQRYIDGSAPLQAMRAKTCVIPIGISDNRGAVRADEVTALRGRYPGKKIVFALGRMAYYKGFEVLVDAAARLSPDTVVLIGGGGEGLPALRARIDALGLQDRVHLPGPLGAQAAAVLFEACDVFCLPSVARSEAYGLVLLEAMAAGRPVVATDIAGSGVPWVNAHQVTGLNVPVADAPALAEALRRLLDDDDLRRRCGQSARQRFEDEFHAPRMIDRTVALYRQVLARRTPPPLH